MNIKLAVSNQKLAPTSPTHALSFQLLLLRLSYSSATFNKDSLSVETEIKDSKETLLRKCSLKVSTRAPSSGSSRFSNPQSFSKIFNFFGNSSISNATSVFFCTFFRDQMQKPIFKNHFHALLLPREFLPTHSQDLRWASVQAMVASRTPLLCPHSNSTRAW